jgi:hypothetical protein
MQGGTVCLTTTGGEQLRARANGLVCNTGYHHISRLGRGLLEQP